MAVESRIRLLETDSDLGRYLTAEERRESAALTVPQADVMPGDLDVSTLLSRHGAFGAIVADGMLAAHLRIGEQPGMRILGPGDVVSLTSTASSMLLADAACRAVTPTRLALLGRDVLVGVHRWPRLMAGIYARATEQIDRIAVQLAICQLPRVEDRLLALLWLLAESWGRVTPNGTTLPLALTHETLGALIGARRPTVTLALGELTQRGAVLRQGRTWLLVEQPATPAHTADEPHAPVFVPDNGSLWGTRELPQGDAFSHDEMMATVQRLRAEHLANAHEIQAGLERVREARERSEELRERVRHTREVSRTEAPSSR
jgi:CRP-like cAMP-binding protein